MSDARRTRSWSSAAELQRLGPLARVRAALVRGARRLFEERGLIEIRTPVLADLTGVCENVSSVLSVDGERWLLTQTGQLALERALTVVDGVWCHTGSYRGEIEDTRHLCEFELIEEELSLALLSEDGRLASSEDALNALISRIEGTVKAMLDEVVITAAADLAALGGDANLLRAALEAPFERITYQEGVQLLERARVGISWGSDLGDKAESQLLAELSTRGRPLRPTFVTHFPEELKFFNMKQSRADARVVYSVDLLLPGVGEAVGGAVREDDAAILQERFERLMLPRIGASFPWPRYVFAPYLEAVSAGVVPPHAGYGVGLERILRYVTGERDIRRVSMPSLLGGAA